MGRTAVLYAGGRRGPPARGRPIQDLMADQAGNKIFDYSWSRAWVAELGRAADVNIK